RNLHLVRALVIEEASAEISLDTSFVLEWTGTFKTREELERKVGARLATSLRDSLRETAEGWRLAFEPGDMVTSQAHVNGNHWADWLATSCPALLIRGQDSRVTTQEHLQQMESRRPNTHFLTLQGGHIVHLDNAAGFAEAVKKFLDEL
ncbi:MAG TPA: alpha/beta hydrolase, partial [Vicinamibacterales bacterium]|nr:alpha/beta hydrolase [Vicinamibacterales bacterium]